MPALVGSQSSGGRQTVNNKPENWNSVVENDKGYGNKRKGRNERGRGY